MCIEKIGETGDKASLDTAYIDFCWYANSEPNLRGGGGMDLVVSVL